MEASITLPIAVWQAVETSLSDRFGAPVSIVVARNFWPSRVFRCAVRSPSGGVPGSIIVRLPREGTARTGSPPLDRERLALEYLTAIGSTLAPRFLVGGSDAGFLVSEDLGAQPSLLDLLLGTDRDAATRGAIAFARGLGRMHAQTTGRPADLPIVRIPVAENWNQVCKALRALQFPEPCGVERDIQEIVRILDASVDSLALSSGDPSVVNCAVTNDGVRFFDFEEACFQPAPIDATVLRFLYPTGAPAWQLPPGITERMESAYKAELEVACPTLADDAAYEEGMEAASAAWMILRMVRLPRVDAGPDRDSWQLLPPGWSGPSPMRSRRRQLVSILETWIATANRTGRLQALASWCERLVGALQARWPEATEELPIYPAFCDEPSVY